MGLQAASSPGGVLAGPAWGSGAEGHSAEGESRSSQAP